MRILLIDSDFQGASGLIRELTGWGETVTYADSGRAAVSKAKEQVFDLVLMDLILMDSMGVDIIPDLKLFNPGVRVIAMTGISTPDLERKAREGGIIFYMEKPVPLDQLKLVIEQLKK